MKQEVRGNPLQPFPGNNGDINLGDIVQITDDVYKVIVDSTVKLNSNDELLSHVSTPMGPSM